MSKIKDTTSIVKLVLAVLFVLCLSNMPYGYFQLVRFLGMIGFAYLAYAYKRNKGWMIFYISSAILINPFFKIALSRELWNTIDIIWAVVLICSVIWNKAKGK